MHNFKKLAAFIITATFAVAVMPWAAAAQSNEGLRTQGNQLLTPDGKRFVIKGANVEAYRDYAGGCGDYTDRLFPNPKGDTPQLGPMITKMKSLGVNAIRLNYAFSFLYGSANASNLANYETIMSTLAANGIYVMPSDHSQTANPLTYASFTYPMLKTLITYAQSHGIEKYLIINPYNEPANFDDPKAVDSIWSPWALRNMEILRELRTPDSATGYAGYKGLIFLDTPEWAGENNPFFSGGNVDFYRMITSYDAELLGGTPNVGFSNHWYPKSDAAGLAEKYAQVNETFNTIAKKYPLIIGELGQYNENTPNPTFVADVLKSAVQTGIPNGHNGVFPWIWAWCDSNKMTDPYNDYTKMTTFGQIFVDNYYTQVTAVQNPLPTIAPQPLLPTSTPMPKPSPTPTPYSGTPISYVGSATGQNGGGAASVSIPVPAGIKTGDFLIAHITVQQEWGITITMPAGWTLIRKDNSPDSQANGLYYKFATASEPSSYTWSFSQSNAAAGGIAAYRGVNSAVPIDSSSGYCNYESPYILAPAIQTHSTNDRLLLIVGLDANAGMNIPAGMAERWKAGTASTELGGISTHLADMNWAAIGSTGDINTSHTSGKMSSVSMVVALKPMPGGATITASPDKPGDANGDGRADDLDYLIWAANYGTSGTAAVWTKGNFNGDNVIDDLDYLIWANNYGK